jgi:superfamily II DNA or RNA helicase
MSYSHSNLRTLFGAATFERGLQYFQKRYVLQLSTQEFVDETVIQASTAGSRNAIYEQYICIEESADALDIDGDCTCPVGYNCKHVVAVCLAFAQDAHTAAPAVQSLDPFTHWLQRMAAAGVAAPTPDHEYIVYLLKPDSSGQVDGGVRIETRVVKPRKNGLGFTRGRSIQIESIGFGARLVSDLDRDICSMLLAAGGYWHGPTLTGRAGYHAATALLESERCYWMDTDAAPLTAGPARQLELAWQSPYTDGDIELVSGIVGGGLALPTTPPLYLDPDQHVIGELNGRGLSSAQIALLGAAPRVAQQHAEGIAQALATDFAQLPMPLPTQVTARENSGQVPQPCLRLYGGGIEDEAWLILDFMYDPDRIHALPRVSTSVLTTSEGFVRVGRDPVAEDRAHARLSALGFSTAAAAAYGEPATRAIYVRVETDTLSWASSWSQFLREVLPQLSDEDWHIEYDASFDLQFETGSWSADIADDDSDSDWFSLGFRLDFGGTSLPLLDVLGPVLDADWSALPQTVAVPVGVRHFVEVPSARLRPLLDTLRALFGERTRAPDEERMRLSRYEAGLLTDLENQGFALEGGRRWRQLAQKLNDFDGIRAVPVPAELIATLRPYQQRGLDWLQFLCEYGFNGVLADDMGLGKTVQTLAHLLVEKGAGRLDCPALLVAPTSLMGNWQREAARFAPTLKVALLHGVDRGARYVDAAAADLLLTTYSLLPRDAERLGAINFHSVILDEAQNVKNPRAKAAQVLRRLKTRHRLCLTGTPLENHLGELWALFDFLMPGFLGERGVFRRIYRTPIEQHGDGARQAMLARRISPFMLRRNKQEVASELPPKTEMVQPIELGPAQAELYESIRASMDKRVREAIVRQGLARSHITILDALLKLRQVCCDPRLLKLRTGNSAPPSAKLEFLLDLLEELLAEGRKILLFSQFTSMLTLIEDELARRSIDYAKLTGQTRKRDEAIDRFRNGEVPLFVISLKAGGVGLNLPEADTVIHYDPWWNPAVEAQATDRAHRIGQTQPVFVYKLIVANSVEARMLELQERKRALAAGIYAGNSGASNLEFDADALASLLAPIEHDVAPVNERPPARTR